MATNVVITKARAHHPRVSNNLLVSGREEGERENGTGQTRSGGRSLADKAPVGCRDCGQHLHLPFVWGAIGHQGPDPAAGSM
ncbi:hypothetical protein SKAU_G00158250 [Synaphobranchus kaupii]|uniref:Uncharacterized protein n=1 Tax=Synaphobranchus kaupii TaxID=118154 RepID=A0A9Q1FIJ7_SYNKA|nr:hypothetical protein SKAU_G00158250 [Synaphobranchus kaupii]